MIHQVLAVAVLSAAVASAAYAGEQCYEGIAYVGFRDGVQVAYGCGTPPEGGNVQNTVSLMWGVNAADETDLS